ncbi:HpcH/HpaI aldolase family protein [Desulfitobacterium chlororespirans]|uniref:4-hydroxy-2-oxoheptanedioate aldolase n=1 Tax=Desulfitobacterium chlororespirans DSM 11544 TaxID=1121395 RepID=A0A1M7SGA2_9FIRM|nr:aldolase/citrate lyase family protein [Desulfitobacterium chlororespirans]SHN57505.1 4-hydroxy-2-oxoheptanedioate aldolase [Desulfitobacterium chlororespirans DSM 11544]
MKNQLKQKLGRGEKLIGCFVNFFSPPMAEILGAVGFDFMILDNEHGCFSQGEIEHMIRAADVVGLPVVVRTDYDHSSIQKALDMGAAGIQVPMVNTREQALAVVARAKYPPLGRRGVDYYARSARLSGSRGGDYLETQNRDVLIVVQIETPEAAANFEQIVTVPGVDLALLGALDLSVSMGLSQGPAHPQVKTLMEDLADRAKRLSVPLGMVFLNPTMLEDAENKGAVYLATTLSGVLTAALQDIIGYAKAKPQD